MKILPLLSTLFLAAAAAVGQACDHTSDSFTRFDEMRVSVPVSVTLFDGRNIEGIATSTKDRVDKAVKFYMDGSSTIAPNFRTDYKKSKWWVIYSTCDNYSYFVLPVLKDQYVKK